MYRLIVESLLGLSLQDGKLSFSPCLPEDWKEIKISYLYLETLYRITIRQTAGDIDCTVITLDGSIMQDTEIVLANDKQEHMINIVIVHATNA